MRKNNIIRFLITIIVLTLCCTLFLTACGEDEKSESGKHESSESGKKNPWDKKDKETEKPKDDEPEDKPTDEPEAGELSKYIEHIQVASDDTGIYAVVLQLKDNIADEGSLEWIYYGPKGSAQENVIVCTYTVNYTRTESGKYEIYTFYDGKVDLNQHGKDIFKVNNTFGALVRAKDITITYTPKGGTAEEIFHGEAGNYILR